MFSIGPGFVENINQFSGLKSSDLRLQLPFPLGDCGCDKNQEISKIVYRDTGSNMVSYKVQETFAKEDYHIYV